MLNENRFLGTFRGHNTRTIVYKTVLLLKLCKADIILSTCIIKTYLSSYYCLQFWKATREQGETFVLKGQMVQANSTFVLLPS
jgi:hypothetical protein